jgi:Ca-activated chloride channel family protein
MSPEMDAIDPGFLQPWWLLAGLVVMLGLAALLSLAHRAAGRAARRFIAPHLAAALTASLSLHKRLLKAVLLVAGTGLLFVALARPHLYDDWIEQKRGGLDVLLAVDCSRSMLTEDVHPNRLERAKLAICDFADQVPGDRLGLIAFAGDGFLECPLTLDHEAFTDAVRDLDTNTIPRPGTDIAAALDEAVDALKSQPDNLKFLVLVTDGEDLEGRALAAARKAAQAGVRVFTVGVGTAAGDRIPDRDETGAVTYHRDDSGQDVISHLDEGMLRQIADITGGAYVPLGQRGEGLASIYSTYIEPLPKQSREEHRERIPIERYEWPLALAVLCLTWEFLVNERRGDSTLKPSAMPAPRATPRRRKAAAGVPVSAIVTALILLQESNAPGASTDQPERDYKAGHYEESMQGYEKAAEATPAESELQYNRGDAAYRAGDFSEAEDAFHRALDTPDLDMQEKTYFNLGNTQYQHGSAMLKVSTRKTIKLWKQALRNYDCALQLKDSADARKNYQIVKEKLEQLRQQLKQRGKKGSSDSGKNGQTDADSQGNGKSGDDDSDDSDDSDQQQGDEDKPGGQHGQKDQGGATGDKQEQKDAPGSQQNLAEHAYSGTRSKDLKDPQIKSREAAEDLLDSLKDDQRRVTARSMLDNNGEPPPPASGKDW